MTLLRGVYNDRLAKGVATLLDKGEYMSNWSFDLTNSADQRLELDSKLRGEILALDNIGRGDEIHGSIGVIYSGDRVKGCSLIGPLEARGVAFSWKLREVSTS